MKTTFNNIIIRKDLETVPPALYDFPGNNVLIDLGMEDIDMGRNALIVILFIFIFRLYAAVWSSLKHTGKKMRFF